MDRTKAANAAARVYLHSLPTPVSFPGAVEGRRGLVSVDTKWQGPIFPRLMEVVAAENLGKRNSKEKGDEKQGTEMESGGGEKVQQAEGQ